MVFVLYNVKLGQHFEDEIGHIYLVIWRILRVNNTRSIKSTQHKKETTANLELISSTNLFLLHKFHFQNAQ